MESSRDKTVRNMINNLCNYQWLYQYSFFVDVNDNDIDEAKEIATTWLINFNNQKFKDYLRKRNSDIAIYYILRKTINKTHPSNKRFQQYYITMFTTDVLTGVEQEDIQPYSEYRINVMSRKVLATKILSTCNALKTQNLHNLSSLGERKRFTILNKSKLVPIFRFS